MAEALAEQVIERHRHRLHGRARRITIDLDPTDDPTHGAQQMSFFNSHYDTWLGPDSALPVLAHPEEPESDAEELFATLDAEAEEEEE